MKEAFPLRLRRLFSWALFKKKIGGRASLPPILQTALDSYSP
jgi:hypothetical protein